MPKFLYKRREFFKEWDCKLEEAAEKIADTCDEKATDVYAQNGVK